MATVLLNRILTIGKYEITAVYWRIFGVRLRYCIQCDTEGIVAREYLAWALTAILASVLLPWIERAWRKHSEMLSANTHLQFIAVNLQLNQKLPKHDRYTLCSAPAPMTAEQRRSNQRKLWRRYSKSRPGGKMENSLVEEYIPLVKTVVGRLAMTLPSHVNTDDLYSAGLVGLLNAMRRFKPNNGTSFETYARVRIRGAILMNCAASIGCRAPSMRRPRKLRRRCTN